MKAYYKRASVCFVLTLCIMLAGGFRVLTIATDGKLFEVASSQSKRSVKVEPIRGSIYDCNGRLLTDKTYRSVTVQLPSDNAAVTLAEIAEGEELEKLLQRIRRGQSVIVYDKAPITKGCWETVSVPVRYDGSLCHLLGYTDIYGHGVVGVEKAFDNVLYSEQSIKVNYITDSHGRALEGVKPSVEQPEFQNSVTLTVDSVIQAFSEQAMAEVESGAALVLEANTGKIKAVVSCPDFDPYNVAESLTDSGSPLINRAAYSYNVGSVFKPLIAAVALENGMGNYRYNCTGSITVGNVTFKCNRISGHGEIGMTEALAHSCNTFFYTLSAALGAEKVHSAAVDLRFGRALDCGGDLVADKDVLPSLNTLNNIPAELTNLSVGQGQLMLSPLAMAQMYSAIVNGGSYRLPYLVERVSFDGNVTDNEPSPPTKVFSSSTADSLKEMLKTALKDGTGSEAYVEGVSIGGKTGTAQTGWVTDGRNVLNGWFCGFYEGKTDYCIIILKEDVKSGSTDCAPIFKKIVTDLKNNGY